MYCCLVELHNLAILVHQEFAPAPWDLLDTFFTALQFGDLPPQELEHLVGILTIDIDFLKNWEFDSAFFLESLELLLGPLLLVEGVRGESQDG